LGQYTKHGTRIFSTSNGSTDSETITDANGNQISGSSPASLPGTWTVTDTLGRTLINDGSYFDSNGTLQHLAITYTTVQFDVTAFCSDCNAAQKFFSRQLPQTITFPNGMRYTFAYVQNSFGQPSSVTLPNSGIIGLTWSGFDLGGPNVQTRSYTDTSGQTSTWTYTPSSAHPGIGTVTDPLANDMTIGCFQVGTPTCYVNQLQSFAGPLSGGKIVKTVTTDYQGIPAANSSGTIMPIRVTTALNVSPGSTQTVVSKVETDYETANLRQDGLAITWGNAAATREYDFGSNGPGALLRQTTHTYLHDVSTQYRTTNIADRVLTAVICNTAATCDGTGSNTVTKTQKVYDGGSVVSTGSCSPATGALGHDYCNFGSSNTQRGNPTQVKRWLNPGGVWLSTLNSYDDLGHLISTTDPKNNTTSFSYADNFTDGVNHNALAFVTQVTHPVMAGVSHIERKQYFLNTGLLAASCGENFPLASPCTNTYSPTQPDYATYTYEIMDRQISATNGDGGSSTFCYSDMGGATCTQAGPPFKIVSSETINATTNKMATTLLDGFGRAKQTQLNSDPEGVTFTDTSYDAMGRKATVSNPYRSTTDTTYGITTYGYDALGRMTTATQPDGVLPTSGNPCPQGNLCTSYSANCTTVTDEAGKARKSCVDGLGRLTQVFEDPANINYETDYQYDTLDNLLRVDQKGTAPTDSTQWRTRAFAYDSLSRLLTANNTESGTITYGYDANGNVQTKTTSAPNQTGSAIVTTTYFYDTLNRLTKKTYSDGTTPTVQYGYDGTALTGCTTAPPTITSPTNLIDRRSSMCDASGGTSWSYDSMGRVLTHSRTIVGSAAVTKAFNYTYKLDGSMATLKYPSGRTITYTPSAAGRMVSAVDQNTTPLNTSDDTNYVTSAAYAPNGAEISLINGFSAAFAGVTTTNAYNKDLQPVTLSAAAPSANLMSLSYDFHLGTGDNGNVFQIVNNKDNSRNQNFQYDALNRITQASTQGPNWGETFTIDAWGSLTNKGPVTGKTNTEMLNAAPATVSNRLTGFGYDAAGNMTSNGTAIYTYDGENRLVATAGWTYVYDGDGRRVRKSNSASNGTLYWAGVSRDPLLESSLNGSGTEEYVFFNGQRIARRDASNGAVHYYLSDHLGSASVIASATAVIQEESDYYPYGGEIAITNNDPNNYKFTGKERDSESGLDNFEARYYGSSLGRFMTPDWAERATAVPYAVFGDPQTLNLYTYVENAPLNRIDADGHGDKGVIHSVKPVDCAPIGIGEGECAVREAGQERPAVEANVQEALQESKQAAQNKPQYDPKKSCPEDPTNPGHPLSQNAVVKKASDEAWQTTTNGTARNGRAEAGGTIEYKDGTISAANKVNSVNGDAETANHLRITTDANTIAIYHTHGNSLDPRPSPGDRSPNTQVPDFVRSQRSLYVTIPGSAHGNPSLNDYTQLQ